MTIFKIRSNYLSKQNGETKKFHIKMFEFTHSVVIIQGLYLNYYQEFIMWVQNIKRKKPKTITFCQQNSKKIIIHINVKNYCKILPYRRNLKGNNINRVYYKTLIEYSSVGNQ